MGWFWPFDTIFVAADVVVCALLPSVSRALVLSLVSAGKLVFLFIIARHSSVVVVVVCLLSHKEKQNTPSNEEGIPVCCELFVLRGTRVF